MRQASVLMFLLTVGCTNPRPTVEQAEADTVDISVKATHLILGNESEQQTKLTDTTTNGISIKFIELTERSFDSLNQSFSKRTDLPLKSFDGKLTKLDSCVTFILNNGKIDSLCNMDDGEYYEKYQVKGLWEDKNLLLVNFENWEERHDLFINLLDGSYYILTPSYEPSPKLDIIISYVDITATPIYPSELLVTKIQKGSITTLLKRDLGQRAITYATWTSNTDCLISTAYVDNETNEMRHRRKYLIKIE